VALPACQASDSGSTGSSYEFLISPPAPCGGADPTCNAAADFPVQTDLTSTNSENLFFSPADNALTLQAGSGTLVDTDGDGVPDPADECPGVGWRLPCDGDDSNDGIYQTLYFNDLTDVTVRTDLDITGTIEAADVYILMDATGSMRGEQVELVNSLTSGTLVADPVACPTGVGTGLIGALRCAVPDLWIGVGDFKEVSYLPHNDRFDMAPYHHYLDTTDNVQNVADAVAAFVADNNRDYPEATSQALYSVVTGTGLGDLVPNRGSCPSTPAGRWGYPCFRPTTLPIIALVTDADMWNGPVNNGHTYGDPPFDGTLGLGTRLPPVEQSPNVLYSDDPLSAWNLGDLTNTSMTVMGSNVNLGNDAQTWDLGACQQCDAMGMNCWSDGRDSFLTFSLSSPADILFSGEGTAYHTTNTALFDSGLTATNCDPGPGGGDFWGRFTQTVPAGTWYAVSDASVSPSNSVSERIGNYQLRIHNQTADPGGYPSWQTADLPLDWTTIETELLASGVKFVNIVSPNAAGLIAIPDVTELSNVTNSLDKDGNPFLEIIAGDGTGLSSAILDAVRSLVGDSRRDISLEAEDNGATAEDEAAFVTAVTATSCPTVGLNNCLGGEGTPICQGCLQDTQIEFSFRMGNDTVAPTVAPQVFDFDMVARADSSVELARIPVRVMVPELGTSYGVGFYENTYDADVVCEMPPERPDWGTLTWTGSTPSDSEVVFEFFTADTLAELDTVIPVSVTYADPTDTAPKTYNVGDELVAGGEVNFRPYLRVRARLEGSSDGSATPVFAGWSTEFNCIPFE
jgi:hypothetical protein